MLATPQTAVHPPEVAISLFGRGFANTALLAKPLQTVRLVLLKSAVKSIMENPWHSPGTGVTKKAMTKDEDI